MTLQANDIVELRGTVIFTPTPGDELVYVRVSGATVFAKINDVDLVHPGFEVGDEAVYDPSPGKSYRSKIVAIHRDQAWLEGDYNGVIDLFELTRPEPDPLPDNSTPDEPA